MVAKSTVFIKEPILIHYTTGPRMEGEYKIVTKVVVGHSGTVMSNIQAVGHVTVTKDAPIGSVTTTYPASAVVMVVQINDGEG